MIGFEWWFIYSTNTVFYMSNILKTPELNPAANKRAFGCPLIHVHIWRWNSKVAKGTKWKSFNTILLKIWTLKRIRAQVSKESVQ